MSDTPDFSKNQALAGIFHDMAACYRFLGPAERFRAMAYEKAAQVLNNMTEDIASLATDIKTLDAIGGIGEGIAGKIMEYMVTGQIQVFEELKKKVPFALLNLMEAGGIGPATLRNLHDALGISNSDELAEAIRQGKLRRLKGFGVTRVNQLMRALKMYTVSERLPYADAAKIALEFRRRLLAIPGVQQAELAGSLRRKKETIGDIDIVMVVPTSSRRKVVQAIRKLPGIKKILSSGLTRISLILRSKLVQADIRLVALEEYGAALLYFTGSKEYNVRLRLLARNLGCKLNEYGLFDLASGKKRAGDTEESLFSALGLPFVPPEKRVDQLTLRQAA
jgi:DNA polymerase (family 10)